MAENETPLTAGMRALDDSVWAEYRRGDRVARELLLTTYYQELRAVARRILSSEAGVCVLQPTELTNEAAIKLLGFERIEWRDRAHFIATAASVMRHVLIDEVRRAKSLKRGGREIHTRLTNSNEVAEETPDEPVEIEALDQALTTLQSVSPDLARVVELRYFVGLNIEEIAEYLQLSDRTVKRRWSAARIWLLDRIASLSQQS